MKRNIAIIDPLGAHGSALHFYLFSQAESLINYGVTVSLYTNKETKNPNILCLRFYQFYGFLFSHKIKVVSGLKYLLGSALSIFHARFQGYSVFHFHLFYTMFNIYIINNR